MRFPSFEIVFRKENALESKPFLWKEMMQVYYDQKIMIATDGSDTSKKAAEVGIEIARRSKGSIIAVYVVDVFRLSHIPGYATFPGLKDKLLELMEKEGIEATQSVEDDG